MAWSANDELASQTGRLLKPALNARRLALQERCLAVGRTLPVNCYEITTGKLVKSSWFTAFQSEITALIPMYVNHTDNGGDWDGQTILNNVAPAWNQASILTAIGDASRISAPTDSLICATWIRQQRDIINLLRWTYLQFTYTSTNPDDIKTIRLVGAGTTNDWENSKTAFNAINWGDIIGDFPFLSSIGHYGANSYEDSGDIMLTRRRGNYSLSNATGFDYEVDSYFMFSTDNIMSNSYNNNDYPLVAQDVFTKIESDKTIINGATETLTIGDLGNATVDNPYPLFGTNYGCGWSQGDDGLGKNYKLIKKFTGANGFTYKNW